MAKRKKYILTEAQLNKAINHAVNDVLTTGDDYFMGVTFGLNKRMENRRKMYLYANRFHQSYYDQLSIINQTIIARKEELGISDGEQAVNEGIFGAGGKPLVKNITKAGLKKIAKRAAGGVIEFGAILAGQVIATTLQDMSEDLSNPDTVTVDKLLNSYSVVCNKLIPSFIADIEKNPEILGAEVFNRGRIFLEQQEEEPFMTKEDLKVMAVNLGASILANVCGGPVSIIYNVIDIAGAIVAAKAWSDEAKLSLVEEFDKCIRRAIPEFMRIFQISQKVENNELSKLLALLNGTSRGPLVNSDKRNERAAYSRNMRAQQQPAPQVSTTAVRRPVQPGALKTN